MTRACRLRRAQTHALLGIGPMADGGEHQAARHGDFYRASTWRAPAAASSECGQGKSLLPNPEPINGEITSMYSSGMPSIWRQSRCDDSPRLALISYSVSLSFVPDRDGGVHFHRVVSFGRRDVGLVEFYGRFRKG